MKNSFFSYKRILPCIVAFCFFFIVDVDSQDFPNGYRSIKLGMNLEEVKKALSEDSLFAYRGDRDVSLLPNQDQVLIETEGSSFLSRCWFQFHDQKLYIITITMNDELMDYYSVFKTLFDKYGQPDTLSPETVVWEKSQVRMSLERPLTIKYIDTAVYNNLLQSSQVDKSSSEFTRQKFLESF